MKYKHYLYIVALAFLIACSSEERTLISNTKGEVDSGIVETEGRTYRIADPMLVRYLGKASYDIVSGEATDRTNGE